MKTQKNEQKNKGRWAGRLTACILSLCMVFVLVVPVASIADESYLVIGAYGEDVAAVQSMLFQLGYYYGEPDGDYGYVTYDAVLRFQADYGLYADGEAGPITIQALYDQTGGPIYGMPSAAPAQTASTGSLDGFSGSLSVGSYGDEVSQVQSILVNMGYLDVAPDGYFGYVTEQSVIWFQQDHGLYVDGVVGPITMQALLGGGSQSSSSSAPAASAPSGDWDANAYLVIGAYGSMVTQLQQMLYSLGYYYGDIDGDYGYMTAASVEAFQRDRGLYADGEAGPITLAALQSAGGNPAAIAPSTPAASVDVNAYLVVGAYGDTVVQLQKALNSMGYYYGDIDGDYGYMTAAAVEAYQRDMGLYADGEAGPITLKSIFGSGSTASAAPASSYDGKVRFGGTYVLTSAAGSNVLNVSGASTADGADVSLNASTGDGSQKWVMQSAGDGYYYLRNLHSWKVLDLVNGNVQQSDATGASSQKWKVVETSGGFQVVNANGMYLDGSSGSAKAASASGSTNQVWKMQEVNPGTALDFTRDGTQTLGIRTFQISQGNVTETSGYYNIQTDIDIPSGDYYLSGGGNYSIGLKVMKVNTALVNAGYLDSSYYNYNRYDGNTTWAVTRFQQDHGLYVDGVVGSQTWQALGLSMNDYNNLGAYVTNLKVPAYGSSRDTYVNAMLSTAQDYAYSGTGYSDGASGVPGSYVDCSGLIFQCLYAAGINPDVNIIDHARVVYEYTSNNLGNDWRMGEAVGSAQPGDLVFYGGSSINHVAIYAGNGMIYDSWPGQGVTQRNIYSGGNILKIVRVF